MNYINIKELTLSDRKLLTIKDDYFTIILENTGIYEPHFTKLAELILKNGDVAFDLGANLGYHTITLSRLVGNEGRIGAIEPQRIIYQQLNANIFLNGLDNVLTYNFAVGDVQKKVNILPPDYHNTVPLYTNIGNTAINLNNQGETIDQYQFDMFQLHKLNLLKLDIQGSELYALQGGVNNITKHRPVIFIEIEEKQLKQFQLSSKNVIDFIKSLGYKLYQIQVDSGPTEDFICYHVESDSTFLQYYPYNLIEI